MRNKYPGLPDNDAATEYGRILGCYAIVRYKSSAGMEDYNNIGLCGDEKELDGYLDSPDCHDAEVIYDIDAPSKSFYDAVIKDDLESAQRLLEQHGDVVDLNYVHPNYYQTPLTVSAVEGRDHAVRFLLDRGADPDQPNATGITPLMHAAQAGHLAVLRTLLAADANPSIPDYSGGGLMDYAAAHPSIRRELESKTGLDPGATPPKRSGPTYISIVGHKLLVTCLAWSPTGEKLASASSVDDSVRFWDTAKGSSCGTIAGVSALSLSWSPDGSSLALGISDGTVRVYDADTKKEIRTLCRCRTRPWAVAWSPDGNSIAVGATSRVMWRNFGWLGLFDAAQGRKIWTRRFQPEGINNLAWSPDGTVLASAENDLEFTIRTPEDGSVLRFYPHDFPKPPVGLNRVIPLDWASDGNRVAVGVSSSLGIWHIDTDQQYYLFYHEGFEEAGLIESLAWSPTADIVAAGYSPSLAYGSQEDPGEIKLWCPTTGEVHKRLTGQSGGIGAIAWDPEGQMLATGAADGTIRLWPVSTTR